MNDINVDYQDVLQFYLFKNFYIEYYQDTKLYVAIPLDIEKFENGIVIDELLFENNMLELFDECISLESFKEIKDIVGKNIIDNL